MDCIAIQSLGHDMALGRALGVRGAQAGAGGAQAHGERGAGGSGARGVLGTGAARTRCMGVGQATGRAAGSACRALGALSLFLTRFDSVLFLSQFLDIVSELGS